MPVLSLFLPENIAKKTVAEPIVPEIKGFKLAIEDSNGFALHFKAEFIRRTHVASCPGVEKGSLVILSYFAQCCWRSYPFRPNHGWCHRNGTNHTSTSLTPRFTKAMYAVVVWYSGRATYLVFQWVLCLLNQYRLCPVSAIIGLRLAEVVRLMA